MTTYSLGEESPRLSLLAELEHSLSQSRRWLLQLEDPLGRSARWRLDLVQAELHTRRMVRLELGKCHKLVLVSCMKVSSS